LFLTELNRNEKIKEEKLKEQIILAKALRKTDELFKDQKVLPNLVNTNEVICKMLKFLKKKVETDSDCETFVSL